MRIKVKDQFGMDVPTLTEVLNARFEQLDWISAGVVGGQVVFQLLDNPDAGATIEEAARKLNKPVRTVRDMCARGKLQALRYPARWRVVAADTEKNGLVGGNAV